MLQPAVRERIMRRASKLPAAAIVLSQLQRMLRDGDTSLDEVCDLIKRDMSLTARILQLSNSSYFAPGIFISSLDEAVGFVGYDEIYRIAGMVVGMQLTQADMRFHACTAARLWENTLCGAFAMESLAQFAGLNPRLAYTTGMMRSVGKVVLELLAQETAPRPGAFNPEAGLPLGAWEEASSGCDSQAAGAVILEKWNFPPEIHGAVGRQWNPDAGQPGMEMRYALLLNLAARLTEELGYPLPGEGSYWKGGDAALASSRLTDADLALCRAETQLSFDRLRLAVAAAPEAVEAGPR